MTWPKVGESDLLNFRSSTPLRGRFRLFWIMNKEMDIIPILAILYRICQMVGGTRMVTLPDGMRHMKNEHLKRRLRKRAYSKRIICNLCWTWALSLDVIRDSPKEWRFGAIMLPNGMKWTTNGHPGKRLRKCACSKRMIYNLC